MAWVMEIISSLVIIFNQVTPWAGQFSPKDNDLNKFSKSQLVHDTHLISKLTPVVVVFSKL